MSVSRFFSPRKKKHTKHQNWAFPEQLCRRFSLDEMRAATQCFSDSSFVGRGAFGSVYKGYINDGTTLVAIKRFLGDSKEGMRTFKAEVPLLCQLRHPNLISLIGFCQEKEEYFLVYNYTPNGSLSASLFEAGKHPLSWKQRLNICIGVARAIHYLHAGVKHAIIHRDVRCSNILLNESFDAKLSDLGLCKMGPPALSNAVIRVESRLTGTYGYLDPEYILYEKLTDKSDVFSFGMVLLEVLCAKSCSRDIRTGINGGQTFGPDMIDPFLIGKIAPDCLTKYMEIIQRCVRLTAAQRPTMGEVQLELESALDLQESADTTNLNPPDHYTFQGISFSGINHILLQVFGLDSNGSVGSSSKWVHVDSLICIWASVFLAFGLILVSGLLGLSLY